MKITYTENKNGIYYPKLTLPTGTTYYLGKYGRLYLDYLKRHRRGTYTTLLTENRLNEHLHQVDIESREMVLKITEEIATARGIDEHLKNADLLRWVSPEVGSKSLKTILAFPDKFLNAECKKLSPIVVTFEKSNSHCFKSVPIKNFEPICMTFLNPAVPVSTVCKFLQNAKKLVGISFR